jgi:outer membrane protein
MDFNMKKILALFTFILFATTLNSYAADIAVVDIQKVLQDAEASKDIRDQIKVQRDKYQAEITKEEDELRKSEQKLNEQKSILSAEAFKDKREEFKDKLTKAQRDVQEKRAQLDAALNDSIGQVQKAVFEIISDMAKEKGFKLAITTAQTLYSEAGMDITDEVLKKLNDKLPKVKVTIKPVEKAAAPAAEKAAPAKAEKKKEAPKKAE